MIYICLLLLAGSSTAFAFRPTSLQCPSCDVTQCPQINECIHGITWDVCNCCETCSKTLGEQCGGPWDAFGKCGYGLVCIKDARECPYQLNPKAQGSLQESNICKQYLFNGAAMGRCMRSTEVLKTPFKRFSFRGPRNKLEEKAAIEELASSKLDEGENLHEEEAKLKDEELILPYPKRRVLLRGILNGYEF